MKQGLSKIFSSEAKDLRKRILFTIAVLGLYSLGTCITIVWAAPWLSTLFGELGFLDLISSLSLDLV